MKRPFFTIGLSMLCTMFLLFAVGTLYTLVFVAVLLVIAAAVALAKRRKASVLLLVGIAALLSVLCFSYTFNNKFTPAITYCGENISIRGTLAEYPRSEDAHSHVYKLKDCEIAGKQTDITVELYNKYLYNCRPGDTLQFTASQLKATERNPTLKTFFLLADGIWLYAYTDSVFIEHYSGSRLRYAAQDLQHTVLQIIADRMQAPEASVLSALMLGRHDTMTLQTAMSFRLCGLAHLFAVSGLHLTFWVSFLLRFFGKHRRHKIPTLAAIGFILFFMALTGFSVSVCRAGFMMIVLLIGNLFRYEPDALNSLGLAVAVLLILNPFSAASASLLLSASATAAIVLTATPVERYITLPLLKPVSNVFLKNKFSSMLGILFTSATTLTALLPLNAYFFGNFSLLAPVSNLLCIPAAEFGMIFGTAAVLCSPIPYFSDCLFSVTEQLLHYVIFISQKIAELPFAIYYTHLKFVFAWAAICAVVLFTFWLCNKRNRKRIFIAAMSCFCALYIGLHISSFADKDHLTLTVYNADNDICITLHDMHGNAAVIGCGNDDYTIEKVYSDLHYAGVLQPRLLLIPRIKAEMNADIQKCIDLWQPQIVLSAVHFKSTDNDILTASESTVTLWDKVNLHYRSDETFSAITISTAETRVLICCAPYSDFTACDENFTSADILICRQSVPTTLCTDSFQQIVLSSDKKEELYRFTDPLFAEKTVCTADEGNITLTIG